MSAVSTNAVSNTDLAKPRTSESLSDISLEKARIQAVKKKYDDLINRIGPASTVIISSAAVQVRKTSQLINKNTIASLACQSTSVDKKV
ncbi:hypothetical protein [Sporomusa sp. KB1]|jgi:hypothetical protein|uniref:hypothetical protein n=1 Tax=Sporomusa sp. KB1 TaxID=943346 RepID=UPI0011A3609C|nr:hypothetical protein [Sporomusa sp. KB1]TWH46414.1 hypothetical protein Salpa_2400 [Sporomusa sp. KB1]